MRSELMRVLVGSTLVLGMLQLPDIAQDAQVPATGRHSAELRQMFLDDQAERTQGKLSPVKDRERLSRVKELLRGDGFETAEDYYHAAMVLQHSSDRSGHDHLTAHVLSTIAAGEGHVSARWLAAAALDRFLVFNDEQQFFGTQFERDDRGLWHPGSFVPSRTEDIRNWFAIDDPKAMQVRADRFNGK